MTQVGVIHENARISRKFWRKWISLISIWANYNIVIIFIIIIIVRERSGSVVECLTRDRWAAGSSLTGVTALCP